MVIVGSVGSLFLQANANESNLSTTESSLMSQVYSLSNKPPITLTITGTVTSTSVLSTKTVTSTAYAVVSNVTISFTNVEGDYGYSINYGGVSFTGSASQGLNIPLNSVFGGQSITVNASPDGIGGCKAGQTVTVDLLLNGAVVADSESVCGGTAALITYII